MLLVATPARRDRNERRDSRSSWAAAVTGDTDAVRVDHTETDADIDRGLGIGDELLEVGVVGFLGITDDRERSVVDDGVTGEREKAILCKRVKVCWEPTPGRQPRPGRSLADRRKEWWGAACPPGSRVECRG